ncbi:MAG: hypothetical protein IJK35_07500, partial [Oscillospiraceae bacterium]|nr:hypothetical protein [Oscillospiraceae bacterium]
REEGTPIPSSQSPHACGSFAARLCPHPATPEAGPPVSLALLTENSDWEYNYLVINRFQKEDME